jgi:hypothetical protein
MKEIVFNANNNVRVQLNPFGKKVYLKRQREVREACETLKLFPIEVLDKDNINPDGTITLPLGELMEIFGSYVYVGGPDPFDMNITLLIPEEEEK